MHPTTYLARQRAARSLLLGLVAVGCKSEPKSEPKPPVVVAPHDTGTAPAAPPADAPEASSTLASQQVTWRCTADPCPWGASQTNHAVVWPASTGALASRLGYTVSAAVYLPAAFANGAEISVETGAATIHAGPPATVTHRLLATIQAGESLRVSGLASGEVVSVQGDAPFTYRAALHPGAPSNEPPPPSPKSPPKNQPPPKPPTKQPNEPAKPTDTTSRVVDSIAALWRCNDVPGCTSEPWTGAVIAWPEWSAHPGNGRPGNNSRSVFSTRGEPLYPYMGPWADGCEITSEAGSVQIVEWQWGAPQWRSTRLSPGESHVIHLGPSETGALIEAAEGETRFRVSLRNCTPQRIQQ